MILLTVYVLLISGIGLVQKVGKGNLSIPLHTTLIYMHINIFYKINKKYFVPGWA